VEILERTMKAINHEEVYPVPVVLWDLAPWMPSMFGYDVKKYYLDFDLKLHTQLKLQDTYPDAMFFPGLHPDYGIIVQPTAFGGKVQWMEGDAPYVHPSIHSYSEIDSIKPIDPRKDGLMPNVLKEWEMLWQRVDKKYIEQYGYLDGHAICLGPSEAAGLILGYDKLFNGYYEETNRIKNLLSIVTEETIKWIKYQEAVNGTLKRLFVIDHLSSQISPSHYTEFYHPYIKAIFDEFSGAEIRLWHNEGKSRHIYNHIPSIGCNVYNFGEDPVAEIKAAIGDKICLMGNINGVKMVRSYDIATVKEIALSCIKDGAKGGGFLLSGAGGLSVGTTTDMVQAMVDASFSYNPY
jgi:uroporphyrinogen decarboxylase